MGYSFLDTIVSKGLDLISFLGAYGALICAVLPIMLFAPGLLISKLRESHKLRKHEADFVSLKSALRAELGGSVSDFAAVAVKRVMVRRNKDAECNYHRSLALAVFQDRIVIFILWKRMGEINLKKLHTQMIENTGFIRRGKSLQLFFAIPDFSGQLVVCAKPKFFYSETASDWDAIGMNQADELETLTNVLEERAKKLPWIKWKPAAKTGSLFLRLVGIYVAIFPALMLLGFREEMLSRITTPKMVTTLDIREAKLKDGQNIVIPRESVKEVYYHTEPGKSYLWTKHGIKEFDDPAVYYFVVEISDADGTCYMALKSQDENIATSGRRNGGLTCRVSKMDVTDTRILSSYLFKNNRIDQEFNEDPSTYFYKVVIHDRKDLDPLFIFLLVWLGVGVAIIIASFSDHVRRT